MKHYVEKIPAFFKRHKWKSIIALVIIILIVLVATRGKSSAKLETATATFGSVVESVSVTGTVSPVEKANLSFGKSGIVTNIYVKVGDHVRAGDRLASLDLAGDSASYQSAAATLRDVSRGLRPEEQSVEQSKVLTAEKDAVDSAQGAYAKAQSALVSYTDALFNNSSSINPTIVIPTETYSVKAGIESERTAVSDALTKWAEVLSTASTSNASDVLTKSRQELSVIKTFMNDLTFIVGKLTISNSNLPQSTINSYTSAVNSALTAVSAAADSLTNAETSLSQANSAYALKVAGNSSDSIEAQQARVSQAAAELSKDVITAPMDGLITAVEPNEGEYVTAGAEEITIQTDGEYKIEAYVPEADIAKVAVGDYSSTTLDAYGSDTYFGAQVISIDPAETVKEGVPTYKVTLHFTQKDDRIRSGMTANLEIMTHRRDNVVAVPYRAIVDDNGTKTVRILNHDGKSFSTTTVMTGLKGSDGTIEIVSGVEAGQKVVTYVK